MNVFITTGTYDFLKKDKRQTFKRNHVYHAKRGNHSPVT